MARQERLLEDQEERGRSRDHHRGGKTLISIRGARIRSLSVGDVGKPPLLLLPSSIGRALEFAPIFDRLGPIRRLVSLDYPGFGASEDLPEIEGSRDLACFVEDFCRAARLERFDLLGFSMGGWVALHFILLFPERVGGLILIATSGTAVPGLTILNPAKMSFKALIERFYFKPEVKKRMLQRRLTEEEREEFARSSRALERLAKKGKLAPDLSGRLGEIAAPTLVIGGEKDQAVPPRYQEALAAEIPRARLALLPECGHAVIDEAPDLVAKEIRGFLPPSAGYDR